MHNILSAREHGTKIAFIPNAGDTYENPYFVTESRLRIEAQGLKPTTLDLNYITDPKQFTNALEECDAVFVAGGNTFWLLHMLQSKKLTGILRNKIFNGLPYFGESAGAVILYNDIAPASAIDDPSAAPNLESTEGLGLVDFFTLPHVDREKYAELFDNFIQANQSNHKIVKLRDDQALITKDGTEYSIVESPVLDLG